MRRFELAVYVCVEADDHGHAMQRINEAMTGVTDKEHVMYIDFQGDVEEVLVR